MARIIGFFIVIIFAVAPIDPLFASQGNWIQTAVDANGGCGPHRQLYNIKLESISTSVRMSARVGRLDPSAVELFGKRAIEWSDEDVAEALRIYRECEAMLEARSGHRTANNPVGDKMVEKVEKNLVGTITIVRDVDRQRLAKESAQRAVAEAEDRRKQDLAQNEARESRLRLQEQAQRDRKAAAAASELAEIEGPKIAEAAKAAEDARRKREAAEKKLSEIRKRADVEEAARKEALAGLWAAEAARKEQIQRDEDSRLTRKCAVTLSQFEEIRSGMSLRNVEREFGCKGTEIASERISGYGTITTYKWEGKSYPSAATASFKNSRLESKAQIGLE